MFIVDKDKVDEKGKELCQVTYDCWVLAMEYVKPGRKYQDIGEGVINNHKKKNLSSKTKHTHPK